ncbi:rubredoxin [Methanobacterium sp.]|uniref:rubredoxin n=1 Tax=Methanobacterium sp. TaxID=2164 RepID=UPI003C708C65
MDKYRCGICGYTYDPEKGEPRNNTAPGTDFGDLPEKWFCPSCGAAKRRFKVTKRP